MKQKILGLSFTMGILLMFILTVSAADTWTVKAGDKLKWDVEVISSGTNVTDVLTLEIDTIDNNVITATISADDLTGLGEIKSSSGSLGIYVLSLEIMNNFKNEFQSLVDAAKTAGGTGEITNTGYTFDFEFSVMGITTKTSMTVEYSTDGILQSYESLIDINGVKSGGTYTLKKAGIPGYPLAILGVMGSLGILIVIKRRK